MTRQHFITRAIRAAERALRVPPGWWGTWHDVTNGTVRVRFSSHCRCWVISDLRANPWTGRATRIVSKHDSRAFAIRKASRL